MPADTAFTDGYDVVEIELEDGTTVHAEPLSVKQFARFWRLYQKSGQGDPEAMITFLDDFPEAIGRPEFADEFTPAELFAMVPRFFTVARTGKLPKKMQKQKKSEPWATETAPSASTT